MESTAQPKPPQTPQPGKQLDVTQLSKMTIAELSGIARDLKLEGVSGLRKQEMIAKILKASLRPTA